MSASESNSVGPANRRWPWRTIIALLVLLALAPTIIGMTPLRNWLINAALGDSFHASTRSASLGYLTPLSIEGFQLQATDGKLTHSSPGFFNLLSLGLQYRCASIRNKGLTSRW